MCLLIRCIDVNFFLWYFPNVILDQSLISQSPYQYDEENLSVYG